MIGQAAALHGAEGSFLALEQVFLRADADVDIDVRRRRDDPRVVLLASVAARLSRSWGAECPRTALRAAWAAMRCDRIGAYSKKTTLDARASTCFGHIEQKRRLFQQVYLVDELE